jgi:predicted MFS family arabinose efflux permease
MSLFLQQVQDLDPLQAGVAMLPPAVGIAAGSVAASRLHGRVNDHVLLVTGSTLSSAMLVWLAQLDPGSSYVTAVLPPLFLSMVGFGLVGLPLTMAATADVGPGQQGLASGLFNTARQVGGAVGLAALVSLAATQAVHDDAVSLTDGFALSWYVGAALVLAGGLGGLALPSSSRPAPVPPAEAMHG